MFLNRIIEVMSLIVVHIWSFHGGRHCIFLSMEERRTIFGIGSKEILSVWEEGREEERRHVGIFLP